MLALLTSALLASAAAADPPAPQIQPGQIASPLVSATIYVRDMDRSLALYRDELKLHVVSDEPSSEYGPGRTVTLAAAPKMLGRVILVDLGPKAATSPPPDRSPYAHSGDFCLILPIRASEIWKFYNNYKDKYVFMSAGPVQLMANPKAAVQGMGELSFRDPDGVYVNIVSVN